MLQGPHGPFFGLLADALRSAGATVWRVGFNRGDEFFWRGRKNYVPYLGRAEDWPGVCSDMLATMRITDLVLYGDTRPIHAEAVRQARDRGIRVHVFEEGYLRPYWVTYERGGSNGHSRLMDTDVATMRVALARSRVDTPEVPALWGDLRQHVFYGALYHFFVMALNRRYQNFVPHRGVSVRQEFRLHLRRLLMMPIHRVERWISTRRVKNGGFPYHLVLLQLEHDASFRTHSPFASQTEFIELCLDGFAAGAPRHHHLVFKAHPLEDGRAPVRATVRAAARRLGVADRVHFLRGGKLASLLGAARSVVTVNSTAAQQALWRGLPLRAFGKAVYCKPEFVSDLPIDRFFASCDRPDMVAYSDYRQYLLETSQIPGGFYSSRGRRILLRQVVDMLLSELDPYDALAAGMASPRQPLRSSA
ncbi:capsule biosynthesis protein CapA [Defluviimonas sp. WL0002]|uniref:Capsule biosynthesis protein CapA n=1 Tax=Albidovulum marisflavi TaxID=2984159 RepID=A0ABT2ZDG1_9RHOB|nr:capsule biosynthesis protein CapA [Defluviimonas sp. WL0002]MCV2869162.1 capsule biosynthesis protein CapA [Defluviimonas sp. WL0002]